MFHVNPNMPGMPATYNKLGDLAISVGIKLPKPLTEALKLAPSISKQLPAYTREAEKQTAKAEAAIDSINLTIQTLGVALVFGGIIAVLLLRERPAKK